MMTKLMFNKTLISGWAKATIFLAFSLFAQITFSDDAPVNEVTKKTIEPIMDMKVTLRKHGYTLGDFITMQAEFTLEKGLLFDPNSVPLAGPINSWLDLREVTFNEENSNENNVVSLHFIWQIFGTVKETQIIKIPEIILQTLPPESTMEEASKDETAKAIIITIPPQEVYLSSVLPEQLGEQETLRALIPPPRFDTVTPIILASLCLGLAALLGGFWLWLQDKMTWFPRYPGSMTLLERQIRHQKVTQQSTLSEADLRLIHAGLAGCAGQSLYPNTLHLLFENAPYLKVERASITHFFDDSWLHFHAKNAGDNTLAVSDTIAWIRRAAVAERLSRHAARKYVSQ